MFELGAPLVRMLALGVDERGRPVSDSPSSEASHLLQHMATRALMVPVFALNLKFAALWLWRPKSVVPVLVVSSGIPDDGKGYRYLTNCARKHAMPAV